MKFIFVVLALIAIVSFVSIVEANDDWDQSIDDLDLWREVILLQKAGQLGDLTPKEAYDEFLRVQFMLSERRWSDYSKETQAKFLAENQPHAIAAHLATLSSEERVDALTKHPEWANLKSIQQWMAEHE